ncbi:MAG: class I SAM-dependent methyltransferase [Ferruginibacter sp.]|nr:class I SAM-dependent methyltransferase [Ferruginibacter sp.]
MYTHFQLAKKYIKYYLTASNGKGHGVHSPFVFEFIKFVLNDKNTYPCYNKIEALRKQLLKDKTVIEVEDFGAGSTIIKTKERVVKDIASSSLKPKKYSRLLFRIIQFYDKKNVLELGTSFGTTTAYLSSAKNNPVVTTMEGSANIANIAQQNFALLHLQNIETIHGDFEHTFPVFLSTNKNIDFAFLDGNHRKIPTLQYFEQILLSCNEQAIIILDDIHWSKEMEEAWAIIKKHEAVTLTIDLFFIGIVFVRKDFKVKQDFVIRY